MTTTVRNKKFFLITGASLIATIWVGVFATLAIMQPALKTRLLILAAGAGATELIAYAGAAWFGINVFKHIRGKISQRGK
ncbi:hypothetical protein GCM10009127_10990 [Alteraurantiacibacter aestuarii]|uniref:Uncharacterized protein n=2 Tax=Alteraurantiacibacter aestuarii TaxID=650004 RepID=A0A844ZKT0_9SPHN|nr:hypothetical protein [Alteraurantiacibacter aestuarii]